MKLKLYSENCLEFYTYLLNNLYRGIFDNTILEINYIPKDENDFTYSYHRIKGNNSHLDIDKLNDFNKNIVRFKVGPFDNKNYDKRRYIKIDRITTQLLKILLNTKYEFVKSKFNKNRNNNLIILNCEKIGFFPNISYKDYRNIIGYYNENNLNRESLYFLEKYYFYNLCLDLELLKTINKK